ncbi:MAG: hypothetical protein WCX28_08900 [Bacteriovoracaceae bacterium]
MKKNLVTDTIVFLLCVAVFSSATPTPVQYNKRCVVKLYSGTSVVATWDALGFGQLEGETLVFTVGSDISPKKVRISGTWSIEEKE